MFQGGQADPELAEQLEAVQREVKQLEIESEHQRQSKKLQVHKAGWSRASYSSQLVSKEL